MMKKFFTISLFVLALTGCNNDAINEVIKSRPESTSATKQFISTWNHPTEKKIPEGMYTAKSTTSSGSTALTSDLIYYFKEKSLTIKGSINGTTLFFFPINLSIDGRSDYSLKNGLITFSKIIGDGALFPIDGTPYEIGIDGTVILYEISDNGIVTKTFLTKTD